MKKLLLIIACQFMLLFCSAQQDPYTSLFPLQSTWYNPSFAGIYEKNNIQLTGRYQWSQLDNNPVTGIFTYDHFFSSLNSAFGLVVAHHEAGLETNRDFGFVYSYRITVKEDFKIRLGTQLSMVERNLDEDRFRTTENPQFDPALTSSGGWSPDVNIGVNIQWKDLVLGFSTKHLTEPSFSLISPREQILYRTHYLTGMYDWKLKEKLSFQPGFLYRNTKGASLLDIYLTTLILEHYHIGFSRSDSDFNQFNLLAGYQLKEGTRLMLSFTPEDQISFGESYELALNISF